MPQSKSQRSRFLLFWCLMWILTATFDPYLHDFTLCICIFIHSCIFMHMYWALGRVSTCHWLWQQVQIMWFIFTCVYEIELHLTTNKVVLILRSVQNLSENVKKLFLISFFFLLVHSWNTVIVSHAAFPSISILSWSSSEDAAVNPCDFDLICVVSVQMAVSLHPALFSFFISSRSLLFGSKQLSREIQKSIMLTKDLHGCSSVDAARPWLSLWLGFIQRIKALWPHDILFLW